MEKVRFSLGEKVDFGRVGLIVEAKNDRITEKVMLEKW